VLIILVFFALSFHLSFGTAIPEHQTVSSAFMTLILYLMGDFDYAALDEANSVMAPVLFGAFLFFGFFLALTLIIGIIDFAYQLARGKEEKEKGKATNLRAWWLAEGQRRQDAFFGSDFWKWFSRTFLTTGLSAEEDENAEEEEEEDAVILEDSAKLVDFEIENVNLETMSMNQLAELHRQVVTVFQRKVERAQID